MWGIELEVSQFPGREGSCTAVNTAGLSRRKGSPRTAQTHILRWLPQNVTHAPAVPQAMVQDSDNAHEQRVTGTFPLVSICF